MSPHERDDRPTTNMDDLPSALRDIGAELHAAARRQVAVDEAVAARLRLRRRHDRRRNVLLVALATALSAGAVAGAGQVLRDDNKPLSGDKPPRASRPVADPGIVPGSATRDPFGGLPWAVRVFSNARGLDCVALGQLRDGKIGRWQAGAFRPLPAYISGKCGDLSREPLLAALNGFTDDGGRTVVYGLARDRGIVSVTVGEGTRFARPGGQGAFVIVLPGLEMRRMTVTTRAANGRMLRVHLNG